jgi:hypothetical protein
MPSEHHGGSGIRRGASNESHRKLLLEAGLWILVAWVKKAFGVPCRGVAQNLPNAEQNSGTAAGIRRRDRRAETRQGRVIYRENLTAI